MAAENWEPIVSSNLAAARYDAESQELVVKFKNDTYYVSEKPVMPAMYKAFQRHFCGAGGRSAGKFFNENLKKQIGFRKIEKEDL